MAIRLKNKINKYFKNIWLIEIFLVVFFCIYSGIEIYQLKCEGIESKFLSMLKLAALPSDYYKGELEEDVEELDTQLYSDYVFLHSIKDGMNTSLENDSPILLSEYINNDIKFIFRNKYTGNLITNDMEFKLENSYFDNMNIGYDDKGNIEIEEEQQQKKDDDRILLFLLGHKEIKGYISNKYKSKDVSIYYNNNDTVNPFFSSGHKQFSKTILENTKDSYEEYYYTSVKSYYDKFDSRISILLLLVVFIVIIMAIKILAVLIVKNKKVKIRGNFIASIIYVIRYGFRFKQTRKTLVVSIIGLSIFFVGYLYLLAAGGYENNLIVTFFERYPFKGSFLLMILPMIGIIYSNKKSIDIYLVNERLKEINRGNLDDEIVERGSTEVIELIQNITKIKDGYKIAVDETLKNEKIKTELISNVSHDLRTPLTSIINYVNILSESNLSEEERSEYLLILEQKSKKLKVLIDDLFEMSKINSGKMKLNKERIEIISLIHQSIGEYSYLYEDKNVEFNVDCVVDEIYMNLDGKLMSRVFENLVINALKYSLEGTRIYVEIKEHIKNVEVSIKNIANYKMEFNNNDVLERFVRGDKSRNSKVEGSGLGLAITKSIVELHNGKVNIIREGDMFKIYVILPKE